MTTHPNTHPDAGVFDAAQVLPNLITARQGRDDADRTLRLLVAYGREFVYPRYRLRDLAAATGMSISGVRGCYGENDIAAVAALVGRDPCGGNR